MAGLRSNIAWFAAEKQTAKGTPVAAPTYKHLFTGGSMSPREEFDQLEETDSARDAGGAFKSVGGAEGDPEAYVRVPHFHKVLELALGTRSSVAGVAPNHTHTITPANSQPYATVHRMLSDVLFEQYEDSMVNEFTMSAEAGQPFTYGLEFMSRATTRLAADPAAAVAVDKSAVYSFNDVAVTFGGVAAFRLLSSFELTYNNGVEIQQTDDFVPYDVYAGSREVTVGFDMLFENLDHYNSFHYGSTTGTAQTPNLYTTSLTIEIVKGVDNSIKLELPEITIEEFPVEPDSSGDPIVVAVRARAQRPASNPVLTATVKNQTAG